MELPLISVLMPVYNAHKYLREAIESILNQSYPHFEFIIVDDCSSDASWQMIRYYAQRDQRMKIFKNSSNQGIVRTRNKCFELRSPFSGYSAIMDADDISLPNRLELEVAFLEDRREYGIVGGNIIIIDENSRTIGKRIYSGCNIEDAIYIKSPFAQPCVMIRNSVLKNVGLYDHRYSVAEDLDLWFRILDDSKGHNLDNFLLKYRISDIQSKSKNLKKTIINTIKIKIRYIYKHKKYKFSIFKRIFIEFILLFFPSKAILSFFKRIEFQK